MYLNTDALVGLGLTLALFGTILVAHLYVAISEWMLLRKQAAAGWAWDADTLADMVEDDTHYSPVLVSSGYLYDLRAAGLDISRDLVRSKLSTLELTKMHTEAYHASCGVAMRAMAARQRQLAGR